MTIHNGIYGTICTTLEEAWDVFEAQGGYLLNLGSAGYVVCDEESAIEGWGRTREDLESLAPDYTEAYPEA